MPGMASGMRMARAGARIYTACDRHPGCVPGCAGCGAGRLLVLRSGCASRAGSRACAQGLVPVGRGGSGVGGPWLVAGFSVGFAGRAWRVCGVVFLVGVPVVVRA